MAVMAAQEATLTDRREEVLAAAAECFMRQGYATTSMDDVAEALGATKGRVYHHFRSKPELFFEVFRRAIAILMREAGTHEKGPGTAADRLARMARAHVLCMMESQPFQRSLSLGVDLYRFGKAGEEHRMVLEDLMDLRRGYEDSFRRIFAAGRDDGSLRPLDPSLAMRTILGAINWVAIWYTPRDGETRAHRERLADEIVEQVLGGYRTP
ncbi:TetR/AcrR family transcriptional regulator [Phreatobacter sp.]|uniref:TetR/AcrR family transcriptional regulator n=1 Tax=Phreatobacter sp. TaxID=1966341 RepID=UPI003F71A667